MNHKAVVVAVDVRRRVRLELDGDVSHGGVELEAGPRAAVLAQDVPCQVIPVVEGQQVILANVESRVKNSVKPRDSELICIRAVWG